MTTAAPQVPAVSGAGTALIESPLERYLSDRSLRELLAAYLLQRLKEAEGPDRAGGPPDNVLRYCGLGRLRISSRFLSNTFC